jgi:hypothetical protein
MIFSPSCSSMVLLTSWYSHGLFSTLRAFRSSVACHECLMLLSLSRELIVVCISYREKLMVFKNSMPECTSVDQTLKSQSDPRSYLIQRSRCKEPLLGFESPFSNPSRQCIPFLGLVDCYIMRLAQDHIPECWNTYTRVPNGTSLSH